MLLLSVCFPFHPFRMACYRHIEANPVRAAMARTARDHVWSSHGANAFGDPDRLVTPHDCYLALSRSAWMRQAAYRTMFEDELPHEVIETLRDATQDGWVRGRAPLRGAPPPPLRG